MSCPDCQQSGSRKALWLALVAVLVIGAIGVAELADSERVTKTEMPASRRSELREK